ncbi:MAG: phospholipid carrier-dependent glycosyltransferase [Proteobacteria bacterium]|nr:phospholipid carrier-dependent glycosyltransferase [Pseudomonadota bacterium]
MKGIFKDLTILFLFLFPFFLLMLGNRPFANPDEGRYVEISREMVTTGDYITPRLNGVKYFEKPPLFYWLQASLIHLTKTSTNEFLMRLWPAFFAFLGVLSTYLFATSFFNRQTGLFSAFLLALTPLYYALSRLIILDMVFSVFITMSLYCFIAGFYKTQKRRLLFYGFSCFISLAILTKGLVALAIAGPLIVIWLTFTKHWKNLFPLYLPTNIALFLALVLPWHILAAVKNPEFLHKYFYVEHFLRYTTTLHLRYKPWWFFIPITCIGLFPWVLLIPSGIKVWAQRFKELPTQQKQLFFFLIFWIFWVLGFYSFSNSKLIPYILPIFPPISILLGYYVTYLWNVKSSFPSKTVGCFLTVLGCGLYYISQIGQNQGLEPVFFPYIYSASIILFVLSISVMVLPSYSLPLLGGGTFSLIITLIFASIYIQKPSTKELASHILTLHQPSDRIGSYKAYFQDLPVYLNQTIYVVDYLGELEFGTTTEDTTAWMIQEQKLLELWTQPQRFYLVGKLDEFTQLKQRNPAFCFSLLQEKEGLALIHNCLN